MHLSDDEILLYLEGEPGPVERSRVEGHVGICMECASTFAGLSRLSSAIKADIPIQVDETTFRKATGLVSPKRNGNWVQFFSTPYRVSLAGIAAILIALTTYMVWLRPEPVRYRSIERNVHSLHLSPEDGATVGDIGPMFRWNGLPGSSTYEMSLMNDQGVVIWSTDVRDTVVSLPPNVVLVRGKTYLWRVESFIADRRLERSALHAFTYAPLQ
jgi:hypothetical protein